MRDRVKSGNRQGAPNRQAGYPSCDCGLNGCGTSAWVPGVPVSIVSATDAGTTSGPTTIYVEPMGRTALTAPCAAVNNEAGGRPRSVIHDHTEIAGLDYTGKRLIFQQRIP